MSKPTASRKDSALKIKAYLSVDEPRASVLGYVRYLPEVGSPMIRDADREDELIARVTSILDELKGLRSRVHGQAFDLWKEDEIRRAMTEAGS